MDHVCRLCPVVAASALQIMVTVGILEGVIGKLKPLDRTFFVCFRLVLC